MTQKFLNGGCCVLWGQIHVARIEQGCVHDVQWQLQQLLRARWPINLQRARPITRALVVADGRVIRKPGGFKRGRRLFVEAQPVHPHPAARRPGGFRNPLTLGASAGAIKPRINPVNANLTARRVDRAQVVRDVCGLVECRAPVGMIPIHRPTGILLRWNDKERGAETLFQLQVALRLLPKIFRQPQVNEWQFQGRQPVPTQLAGRQPPAANSDDRPHHCPLQKTEHRMIELVMSNPRMIHVMRQTGGETVTRRHRRNLHEPDPRTHHPAAHHRDEMVERRHTRVPRILAARQQFTSLRKQIEADADKLLAVPRLADGGETLRARERQFSATKRETVAVNRNRAAVMFDRDV